MASELERLRRLERERALILEAAGEGIYGLDREGRGTFVNDTAMEILGWTPEDLSGRVVHDLHHHSRADGSAYPREECPIAHHFLERVSTEFAMEPPRLTRAHAEQLLAYEWPGNVRELQNVIERAVILSGSGGPLRFDLEAPEGSREAPPSTSAGEPESGRPFLTEAELREQERRNLVAALEHAGWRVSGRGGAAELLGLKPSTVSYRMKAFGVRRPSDRA